jgi:zinc protease
MKRIMKRALHGIGAIVAFIFLLSCSSAPDRARRQVPGPIVSGSESSGVPGVSSGRIALDDPLPLDANIRVGVLPNGLTYYIRRNETPEKRAELRLVVNAGSVLEDEDQRGLAHFLEHMAFNGTKYFRKQAIVDYLESIGMRFGPDLNAYTTYDETVYQLQVPTDREDALPTAVHILDEWAHSMTLDEGEIDKERGVVVEEWRLRRDAASRIFDRHAPVLFHNSRYAERAPIGDPELIKTFDPRVLRRFYRDWYRPDLMAVVAVGDFDPDGVELLIKEHFGELPMPEKPRLRKTYPVPGHGKTLVSVVTDPEATDSTVSVFTMVPPPPEKTVGDYRNMIVESLFHGMLNARLAEASRRPDPPFVDAYSGGGRMVRSREFFVLGAAVKDGGIARGLGGLMAEAERVRLYGFTPAELERQKRELVSGIESAFNERDKRDSGGYVEEYVRNFLDGEPIPGIEYERELHRLFVPAVTLEEVGGLAGKWLSGTNRVVLASSPEKEGVPAPAEKDLRLALKNASRGLTPYEEAALDLPFLAETPAPGAVTGEKVVEPLGVTVWTLSNGATVILKPTDFKNDEVLFDAYAPGGYSLSLEADMVAARTAAEVVSEGGLGPFDRTELGKKLAGVIATATPWIDELHQGVSGSAAPADLETLFQLVHLSFTQPRRDEQAFDAYRKRLATQLANRESSPEEAFWDTLRGTLTGNSPWEMPLRSGMLDRMDLDASTRVYRELFGNAGGFTFFFVGSFEPQAIRPLVERYIASLPSTGGAGSWRDLGIRAPSGVVKNSVKKGIEPKSSAALVFHGPFDWSVRNVFMLRAVGDILEIPLRETLREKLGGTYDVSVGVVPSKYPVSEYRVYVVFGASPDKVDSMVDAVFEVLEGVKKNGPDPAAVEKVREILRRERETNLRRNEFWLSILRSYSINGADYKEILSYDSFLRDFSADAAAAAARTYLDSGRYVQAVLYPEGWSMLNLPETAPGYALLAR